LQSSVGEADKQVTTYSYDPCRQLERQQYAEHRTPRFRVAAETGALRFLASEMRRYIRRLGDEMFSML